MVNVSALFFIKGFQRTDDGELNLLGAVWDRINIYPTDPEDGGCQLAVLMQADDSNESNDVLIEVTARRDDVDSPAVHKLSYAMDPSVTGRNRTGVFVVPGAFFREPGEYVVTAAADETPTAQLRVSVVAPEQDVVAPAKAQPRKEATPEEEVRRSTTRRVLARMRG